MATMAKKQLAPVIYIAHGGGPMPLLGDRGHQEMVRNLEAVAARINKPSAIIVISAHWEEKIATVTSGENPPLIYDSTTAMRHSAPAADGNEPYGWGLPRGCCWARWPCGKPGNPASQCDPKLISTEVVWWWPCSKTGPGIRHSTLLA